MDFPLTPTGTVTRGLALLAAIVLSMHEQPFVAHCSLNSFRLISSAIQQVVGPARGIERQRVAGVRAQVAHHQVISVSAQKHVHPVPVLEPVIPCAAFESILAGFPHEQIRPVPTEQPVVPAPLQTVVPVIAVELVSSVGLNRGNDGVVPTQPVDVVVGPAQKDVVAEIIEGARVIGIGAGFQVVGVGRASYSVMPNWPFWEFSFDVSRTSGVPVRLTNTSPLDLTEQPICSTMIRILLAFPAPTRSLSHLFASQP